MNYCPHCGFDLKSDAKMAMLKDEVSYWTDFIKSSLRAYTISYVIKKGQGGTFKIIYRVPFKTINDTDSREIEEVLRDVIPYPILNIDYDTIRIDQSAEKSYGSISITIRPPRNAFKS